MTETPHARARRAALLGLVLQVLALITAIVMAQTMNSAGMNEFSYFLIGGVPIWFLAVLVFRQHELAALEQMDLELLRREKAATGGGEALFAGEGGGGLGFLVAKQRLEWMQRWVVPFFGLLYAAYLAGAGVWLFLLLRKMLVQHGGGVTPLARVELGLVVSVVLMLVLYLYSRYASGLGRQPQWQLLRACGSYMLASTLAVAALVVCYGAALYSNGQLAFWEVGVAWAIPVLMVVLGVEALLNFVLDIYRPRAPGTEPRACFDSRLLGLISEPGGITQSLAEAINYQFGFQVSHTWFYQLLVRVAMPLVWVSALFMWLLTALFVVQPNELAIVERFGRQIDPEKPLGPGLYAKWPFPIDAARKYDVGQLRQFAVGYKSGDTPLVDEKEHRRLEELGKVPLELWTDDKHSGRDHFNFMIAAPTNGATAPATQPDTAEIERPPLNLARMEVFVQYRVRADRLIDYTHHTQRPDDILRGIAWGEVIRYVASTTIDDLLDPAKARVGDLLRERISRKADELKLGVEIVYCGLSNVHPEKVVAESFRKIVTARQEKIAEIRKAGMDESKLLVEAAGDRGRALRLGRAIDGLQRAAETLSATERQLREAGKSVPEKFDERLAPLSERFKARFDAELRVMQAADEHKLISGEFDLGMGRTVRDVERTAAALRDAQAAAKKTSDDLAAAFAPLRGSFDAAAGDALLSNAYARAAQNLWNADLRRNLVGVGGAAAVALELGEARRWEHEMRAASELALVVNERDAYAAAPAVYKARRYLDVLSAGIRDARKYFLAFEPLGRTIHTRIQAEETARPDIGSMSVKEEN